MNKDFTVNYDVEQDILYIAKQGEEEEFVEIAPGINVEMGEGGEVIGFEIFRASLVFKDVIGLLNNKLAQAS